MQIVLTATSAAAAWIALSSIGYFLLAVAGAANVFGAIAAVALAAGACWYGRTQMAATSQITEGAAPWWSWVLALLFAVAQLLVLNAAANSLSVLPHGDWDAWSIWNLRARMLAGGEWRHAVSPDFSNHPDYPLLTSSFIASLWTIFGTRATVIPQAVAFVFYAGSMLGLTSAVALLRGRGAGWLAGLALAASAGYFAQAPAQYADIPLSLYFLLAFAWLALDQPVAAGFFATCAAWTKNEGTAFALVFLVAGSFLVNRKRLWLGAAPVLAFVAIFKLALAAPTSGSVSLVAGHLTDAARLGKIASRFVAEFAAIGLDWRHPLLLLAVLAVLWGVRGSRTGLVLLAALGAQLAVYFSIYVFTREDLDWLLSTSLSRLMVQIWPCLLFTAFLQLRKPEAVELRAEPSHASRAREADPPNARRRTKKRG